MSDIILHTGPRGKPRRDDWEANQVKISQFIKNFVRTDKRFPTKREIAEGTGLHINTVKGHIKRTDHRRSTGLARALAPDVVMAVTLKAMSGSTKDARLFFQYVMNWAGELAAGTGSTAKEFAQELKKAQSEMGEVTQNFDAAIDADFEVFDNTTEAMDPDSGG